MTTQNVSVTSPLSPAIERVKRVLFQPFDIAKWFAIGFCAWLATLGESGGGGGGGGYNFHSNNRGLDEALRSTREYILSNLYWLAPLVLTILVVLLALGIVVLWVSSRGKFMFLHCVALNRGEVVAPWNMYSREGNSLFVFRLVIGAAFLAVALPLLAIVGTVTWNAVGHGVPGPLFIFTIFLFVMAGVFLAILGWIVRRVVTDFLVPIQYLRRSTAMEAWREFMGLVRAGSAPFILYMLFRVVIGLAVGAIVLIVVFATCCTAGCLLALPYIGTVVLLPVLVFDRAYSAYFLEQFGLDYRSIVVS